MHKIRLVQVYVSGQFPFWPSNTVLFFTDHSLLSEQRKCSCSHHKQALSLLQSITPAKFIAANKKEFLQSIHQTAQSALLGQKLGHLLNKKKKKKKSKVEMCNLWVISITRQNCKMSPNPSFIGSDKQVG